MSSNLIGTLGVMVCRKPGSPPFSEKDFLRELSSKAKGLGMKVFVFCPDDASPASGAESSIGRIQGYHFNPEEGWSIGTFPPPDIIYDRCLHRNGEETAVASEFLNQMSQQGVRLWSRGLPGKQKVHQLLKRSLALKPYLPATLSYTGAESLGMALQAFGSGLFMKPSGGSQGRHTLYLALTDQQRVRLQGRDRSNRMFQQTIPMQEMNEWVRRFTGRRRFIIQPYLKLRNRDGDPFDIRSLVQKNDRGIWSITGIAVRQGANQGLTSNLHGGGTAFPALPYLTTDFGEEKALKIIQTIRNLSAQLPSLLEEGFGRLGELGIDFGVDTRGRVWLLEVNSKPGRRVFTLTGDGHAARLSVEHPIQYARYLLLRQLRRVNT
ncbi:YheC/YheD family protein [Paenibacillus lautus]|uniref:YheC/YheD family endospore coat-associated protein n=1 Tax=Paenibacillus lautus TaxID=1401 RepID=UPI002DBD01C9|nr:YheC/YheD family protein [Paenibacillus lautus]MEC0206480.1 YheC/YheD family protein [Paenibacillus lautus]